MLLQQAKARANSAAFDVLTNIAELPESVAMARNFLNNMEDRTRRIRNLRKVRLARGLQEFYRVFSEAWLEYRYGWRPLVGAANDLVEACRLLEKPSQAIVVSGRAGDESVQAGTHGATWGGWSFDQIVSGSAFARQTPRAFVSHKVGREGAALGVNPVLTAWELVPYSFVVDWFVGVGQAIQANYPPSGVIESIAGYSLKKFVRASSDCTGADRECTLSFDPGFAQYEREEYQRWTADPEAPDYSLYSTTDRLCLSQWTDLIILAEGALNRAFRS